MIDHLKRSMSKSLNAISLNPLALKDSTDPMLANVINSKTSRENSTMTDFFRNFLSINSGMPLIIVGRTGIRSGD
jgi:hypothetical protein